MSQNQKNQKNQNRPQQKRDRMPIIFALKDFGSGKRPVAYLGTGETVYPGTRRFKPQAGVEYQVEIRYTRDGKVGLAIPFPKDPLKYEVSYGKELSPREWIPVEELRQVLVRTLRFVKRGGRLMAFDDGQVVFPDDGVDIQEGDVTVMLRERGTVSFAIPLPQEAKSSEKGLVRLAECIGESSLEDLNLVVLRVLKNKDRVAIAKGAADVIESSRYLNIHDMLGVSKEATADEIKKAFKQKAQAVHPDRVLAVFGGSEKAPYIVRENAKSFFEALKLAHERAIERIDRLSGKSQPAPAVKPVDVKPAAPVEVKVEAKKETAAAPAAKATVEAKVEAKPAPAAKMSDEDMAEKLVAAVMGVESTDDLPDEAQREAEAAATAKATVEAAAKQANLSVEEFEQKPQNIQSFYLKQVRAQGSRKTDKGDTKKAKKERKPAPQQKTVAEQLAAVAASLKK